MKPFDCDICGNKVKSVDGLVRWHYDRSRRLAENFQIVHNGFPCNEKGKDGYFNRELAFDYVFKNIPEFLSYINRFEASRKEVKDFIHRIEKGRSYIRRFNVNKKEVKRLIILLDGLENLS